jgi:hypothetical protein
VVASVASVVAAVLTRELFDAGVVASAALTPLVVALVSDSLYMAARGRAKPAEAQPDGATTTATGSHPAPPPKRRLPIVGAILIGLLAFLIAVLVLTIPEAVSGKSLTGGDDQTTFFGSNQDKPWNTGDEFRSCFDSLDALGDCVDEILQ